MASATVPGFVNVLGNQPVVLQQATQRRVFTERNSKVVTVFGVVQLAVGIFAILFQAAAIGMENKGGLSRSVEFVGCGIWCGVVFMIAGLLGVLFGKLNKTCLIVAFFVCNIVISVIVWILVGFAAANLDIIRSCPYRSLSLTHSEPRTNSYGTYYTTYYDYDYYKDCSFRDGMVGVSWQALDSLLLLLAIFEFVMSVTSATYCCRVLSCCSSPQAPVFVLRPSVGTVGVYQYGPSMQPIFLQQGPSDQGSVYTNHTMVAGPVDYSTGVSSAQLPKQLVQETMPSVMFNGASTSTGHCAAASPSAPSGQQFFRNEPSAPPNYYELID